MLLFIGIYFKFIVNKYPNTGKLNNDIHIRRIVSLFRFLCNSKPTTLQTLKNAYLRKKNATVNRDDRYLALAESNVSVDDVPSAASAYN